ncbi:MAG TPA: hypothetical protein VF134_05455 [Candidatus Dormibacteraeota bacterium]
MPEDRVLHLPTGSGPSQLRDAYELFRLEKQGSSLSHWTLDYYELHLGRFFGWLEAREPAVRRFADLDADTLRRFRAELAVTPHRFGGQLQPSTLPCSHRAIRAFLSVYHVAQLRKMLSACSSPVEETALRILIGSGVRLSELFGLAVKGPDGLLDLMIDSLDRGHAELRVRWDAGAKGKKARRVPVTPSLAAHIKRYSARQRPVTASTALLINRYGRPFKKGGIDAMTDRLKR